MANNPSENSKPRVEMIRQFFSGMTEYAFCTELGVADPKLIDYLSEMLVRFVHNDSIYSIRSARGKRLEQVTEMLAEAQTRRGEERRHIHRHIGDFTLFWTGLYPEVAKRLQKKNKSDRLLDYSAQGKRAYSIASKIPIAKEVASAEVLRRLSDQYEMCAYGLSEVRRLWENRPHEAKLLLKHFPNH